ncbi:protein-disulfide reductase DsbD family protein [Vibrio rhodolitus]|uniref:protein-disulfide reductase DsbD family protein n=1 Tax=Vibrio rhodolitus TaxID=2231649 RepID=UPI003CC55A58
MKQFALLFSLLISSLFSYASFAQSTGWITDAKHPPVKLRLLLTGEQQALHKQVQAVLDVRLEGEWKTYWRSPGEAGIAPELNWTDSTNIEAVDWHWPIPHYFEQLGIMTLGYKHQVSFPLTLTLEDANQVARLKGSLRLPSCTDICVITDYPIDLSVDPATLKLDPDAMFLFNQGMSLSPKANPNVTVSATYWNDEQQQFVVQLNNQRPWQTPQVLVDGKQVEKEFFAKPRLIIENDKALDNHQLTAIFDVSNWKGDVDLTGKALAITISDHTFATEIQASAGTLPIQYSQTSLVTMLGFALLGGLLLNIMPCVLPVLGLKLNSIALQQQASTSHIRTSFIASALGIISSFALIAGALSLLKLGGESIGWGIQFQSVEFLLLMLIVTLLFALNLLGLFEFKLPAGLNTWMASRGDSSHIGHFIQGMFATLLATPCSAPFLGTAVAYALGASYLELWIIFIALGVGMSLPWLLFAIAPNLMRLMPKPGLWMNRIKLLFGFMMLATSIWLVSLLMPFIGKFAVLMLGSLIVILTVIWLGRVHGRKLLIPLLASLTLLAGGGLVVGSLTAGNWATPVVDDLPWQKLQADKIESLTRQGKTVFVEVTADWCITCKANKIGVVLQDPVYTALQQPNMVLMLGDWTTPNPSVTEYLQSHGRYGVPFNIVYGPKAAQGIPLPVILSEKQVMDAISRASQP